MQLSITQETLDKIDLWIGFYNLKFYLKTNVFRHHEYVIFPAIALGISFDQNENDFIVTQKELQYIKEVIINLTIDYNYKFRALIEDHFNLDFNLDEFQSGEDTYYRWLHSGNNKQVALDYLQSILITNDRQI